MSALRSPVVGGGGDWRRGHELGDGLGTEPARRPRAVLFIYVALLKRRHRRRTDQWVQRSRMGAQGDPEVTDGRGLPVPTAGRVSVAV